MDDFQLVNKLANRVSVRLAIRNSGVWNTRCVQHQIVLIEGNNYPPFDRSEYQLVGIKKPAATRFLDRYGIDAPCP